MPSNLHEWSSLLIDLLSLGASIAIAVVLYRTSRTIERQNFSNSLRSAWIDIDSVALQDEATLHEIDFLLHPDKHTDPIAIKRRRWICYMIGNTLSVNYNGIKAKLLPDVDGSFHSLQRSLEGLTRHPEFMQVTEYFYEDEFRSLCRDIAARRREQGGAPPEA